MKRMKHSITAAASADDSKLLQMMDQLKDDFDYVLVFSQSTV